MNNINLIIELLNNTVNEIKQAYSNKEEKIKKTRMYVADVAEKEIRKANEEYTNNIRVIKGNTIKALNVRFDEIIKTIDKQVQIEPTQSIDNKLRILKSFNRLTLEELKPFFESNKNYLSYVDYSSLLDKDLSSYKPLIFTDLKNIIVIFCKALKTVINECDDYYKSYSYRHIVSVNMVDLDECLNFFFKGDYSKANEILNNNLNNDALIYVRNKSNI